MIFFHWRRVKLTVKAQLNTIVQCVARSATLILILTNLLLATSTTNAADPPLHSPLFKPWINGVLGSEPQMQVQRYDDDTYVIRQSIRTNFEGPFLYLLFGSDRALLIDTGASGLKVRPTIDRVIAELAARHHRTSIPLVISHSHSHGDHHQGDAEFRVAAFTKDKHVSWILGAHIEMTTKPGELIPDEASSHPDEHVLEIPYSNLPELQSALNALGDNLAQETHRDFVIFPKPAREEQPFAPPPQ